MLEKQINEKRKEMIEKANKHGLSSNVVIRISQELDKLIYKYQYERLDKNEWKSLWNHNE